MGVDVADASEVHEVERDAVGSVHQVAVDVRCDQFTGGGSISLPVVARGRHECERDVVEFEQRGQHVVVEQPVRMDVSFPELGVECGRLHHTHP